MSAETQNRSHLPTPGGSPRSVKSRAGSESQVTLRPAIVREMADEILECPIDQFLDHYAPFSPSQPFVDKAFDDLLKDPQQLLEELKGVDDGQALSNFIGFSKSTTLEDDLFKQMVDVMNVLQSVDYVEEDRPECRFAYRICSSENMASEIEGTSFRVDACVTNNPNAEELVLSDIAVIAEFKVSGTKGDIKDNRFKLVSAANQIMNDDPRRRWVYGITIEDGQMSVWHFCRSHSVKSESFDFATNVKKFIRVFLSFLYATDDEIGYDPTVRRMMHKGEICYVYEVGTKKAPRYYRTTELLFAARVLCVTGRKTRVWKVVEVDDPEGCQSKKTKNKEQVVLKDGWLDEHSHSEQEIQTAVFKRLSEVQQSEYQWAPRYLHKRLEEAFRHEKYKEYFMEILDSRRIGKTKPRLESAKPNPEVLSLVERDPTKSTRSSKHVVEGSMQSKNRSGLPTVSPFASGAKKNSGHRNYKTKEQHRLIYRHAGYNLSNAKDLLASFHAILDTFIALVLLYLAGWTHRDISVGNIIVVGEGGSARGKLSDLEYAKEFSDASSSADPKTGTPYFMPLEIHSARTLYITKPDWPSNTEYDPSIEESTQESPLPSPVTEQEHWPDQIRSVKFRFLHDLESLWWVMLWIILYRVGGDGALKLVDRIFTYGDNPSQDRYEFFTRGGIGLMECIHERLRPFAPNLLNIQHILLRSYLTREQTDSLRDDAKYAEIYGATWIELTNVIKGVLRVWQDIVFLDSSSEPETTGKAGSKKRQYPRTEPGDNDEFRPCGHGSGGALMGPRAKFPRRGRETDRTRINQRD